MKRRVLLALVLFLTLAIPAVSAETLYVDISSSSCSDANSRQQAMNQGTPWCDLGAAFSKVESGDKVIVAAGTYRNVNTYIFSNKNFAQTVLFQAESRKAVITAAYPDFEAKNEYWKQENTEINTWRTNQLKATGSSVGCYQAKDNSPLYPYAKESEFYAAGMPEGTYWDATNKVLKIRLDQGKDPNSISLECHQGDVIRINSVNNFKLDGFTMMGGHDIVRVENSNGISINNNRILGGLSDAGAIDMRGGSGYSVRYNQVTRNQPESWWWELAKNGVNTETSGIWLDNSGDGTIVERNQVTGYFNGIVLYSTKTGMFKEAKVRYNTISSSYDDSIEIEEYANGYNISYNNISNYFVAFSLVPADSSQMRSYVYYNMMTGKRSIKFTKTTTSSGTDFKQDASKPMTNVQVGPNNIQPIEIIQVPVPPITIPSTTTGGSSGGSSSGGSSSGGGGGGSIVTTPTQQENQTSPQQTSGQNTSSTQNTQNQNTTTAPSQASQSNSSGQQNLSAESQSQASQDSSNNNASQTQNSTSETGSTENSTIVAQQQESSPGQGGSGEACGNGFCGLGETCSSCSVDCGTCNPEILKILRDSDSGGSQEVNLVDTTNLQAAQPDTTHEDSIVESKKQAVMNRMSGELIKEFPETESGLAWANALIAAFVCIGLALAGVLMMQNSETIVPFDNRKKHAYIEYHGSSGPAGTLHESESFVAKSQKSSSPSVVEMASLAELYKVYPEHTRKLVEYINRSRSAGINDELTKKSLLESGWTPGIIDLLMFDIENKGTAPTQFQDPRITNLNNYF